MQKTLQVITIICLALSFTSCKKKDSTEDSTDYYMSAKFAGSQKTYKIKTAAVKVTQDTVYSIGLSAYDSENSPEYMLLLIGLANRQITIGTYRDEGPLVETQIVAGVYNPGTTDESELFAAGLQTDNNPRLTIIITSLTDKTVSGTFAGTYYDHGGEGPGIIAVTEGKFYLPLTQ